LHTYLRYRSLLLCDEKTEQSLIHAKYHASKQDIAFAQYK